jgi:hypothetical protein
MYALLVELAIDEERTEDAERQLREFAIPMISKGEGFVGGTWFRSLDRCRGRNLILFDTEAAAEAAAARAAQGPPPGSPTRFVSAEVFEVLARVP